MINYTDHLYPLQRKGRYYIFYDLIAEFFEISEIQWQAVMACKETGNDDLSSEIMALLSGIDPSTSVTKKVPRLRLETSHVCNNQCAYCHVFKITEQRNEDDYLSYDKSCQFIDEFIRIVSSNFLSSVVLINFYGGEPLLNWSVIKRVLQTFGNSYCGIKINWSLNTNGNLLNDEVISELKKYGVEIHIGCDGPEEINDKLRKTHDGKGTFKSVEKALKRVAQYGLHRQIDSVISKTNIKRLREIVDIASQLNVHNIYLDVLFKPNHLLNIEDMALAYQDAVKYGLDKDINVGGWPTNVVRRIKNKEFYELDDQLRFLDSVIISVDGEIHHSLSPHRPIKEKSIVSYFSKNENEQNDDFQRAHNKLSETCKKCFLNKYCGHSAILQYWYHTKLDAGYEDSCNFLREYTLLTLLDEEFPKKKNYRVSPYYRVIYGQENESAMIYHALFGNAVSVNKKIAEILDSLKEKTFDISQFHFPQLIKNKILIHESEEKAMIERIRHQRPERRIIHLRLNVSESCNLKCHYCYVPNEGKSMSFETAEKAVSEYLIILKKAEQKGVVTIFGGEPLLNWKVFKEAIDYINLADPLRQHIIGRYTITNGVLLDREKLEFLKKNDVKISISLDGPEEIHDQIRITKKGDGSFKDIQKTILTMLDMDYPPNSLVCTIGPHNINSLPEMVQMAAVWKVHLTINDAFAEPRNDAYGFTEDELADKLFEVFLLAKKLNVPLEGTWMRAHKKLFMDNKRLVHCAGAGEELSVHPQGVIKPCPGFTEAYGNIDDVESALNSEIFKKYSLRSAPHLPECQGCNIEGLCAGGCLLNASKVNEGNITKKAESCYVYNTLFERMVKWSLQNQHRI